jgi:hypothetical protein
LFDDEPEQALALVEVERVDAGGGLVGEVADALAQAVADGEFVALGRQRGLLLLELGAAGVDFAGAAVEFGYVDVAGLVEIGDAASLGGGFVNAAREAGELGGEDFVVGCGLAADEGALGGQQDVGAQQDVADLGEHEGVELVGADAPRGATLVGTAGRERVAVAAVVAVAAGAVVGA